MALGEPENRRSAGRDSFAMNAPRTPSKLYRAWVWNWALGFARACPPKVLDWLCVAGAAIYYHLFPKRRQIVIDNLQPVLRGDRMAAKKMAQRLFREFGHKLADLWRFESKLPLKPWEVDIQEWEALAQSRKGQGLLLITPHLGNWELGAPLLASRGVNLLVITQAEPGNDLTELRKASRARWGIETLVIREDAFAFLEIIKRLQDGATIALLIDRPPAPTAVTVEFFGRSFLASIAPAELARATGCALVGVSVVRKGDGYLARLLPEFAYDRRKLGDRAGRQELTQRIMRAFEPVIEQNLDQWFHFVPIWPPDEKGPSQ